MMIQNNVIIVKSGAAIPCMVSLDDFLGFTGDITGTVQLEPIEISVSNEKVQLLKELFGSWIESGDEDKQLDELYQSRFTVSSLPISGEIGK